MVNRKEGPNFEKVSKILLYKYTKNVRRCILKTHGILLKWEEEKPYFENLNAIGKKELEFMPESKDTMSL